MSGAFILPRTYLHERSAGGLLQCRVVSFSKLHGSDTHDLLRTSSGGCYEENVPVKFQLGLWPVRLERSQVRLPAVLLPGHYYMTLGKSSWEDASSALGQNGTAGMGVRTWRSVGVG